MQNEQKPHGVIQWFCLETYSMIAFANRIELCCGGGSKMCGFTHPKQENPMSLQPFSALVKINNSAGAWGGHVPPRERSRQPQGPPGSPKGPPGKAKGAPGPLRGPPKIEGSNEVKFAMRKAKSRRFHQTKTSICVLWPNE